MEKIKQISIKELFNNVNYVVPIYQRNYAWGEVQIEQLIEDIKDRESTDNYFLGTLIVNKNADGLEVIDGQQRLTTLFLLLKALKRYDYNLSLSVSDSSLRFEARHKSNYGLSNIDKEAYDPELGSPEIKAGWDIINQYIKKNNDKHEKSSFIKEFVKKLDNVFIIRVFVPEQIDLNHYFEVMNTRGEQLEAHEIVKSYMLAKLDTKYKYVAAKIWEACSDMSSYVQMNFNIALRNMIFDSDWNDICNDIKNFDDIIKKIEEKQNEINSQNNTDNLKLNSLLSYTGNDSSQSLSAKLENIKNNILVVKNEAIKEEKNNERFESAISFSNFLLQVNAVIVDTQNSKDNESLDDKKLIVNLERHYDGTEDNAKNFIFNLLKYRILFDKYIIKREFTSDYKEDGKWSLKQFKKSSEDKNQGYYVNTFNDVTNNNDVSDESSNNILLKTLQSCLRVTYTSPKTMHWITEVLKNNVLTADNITTCLENYCREKIEKSDYKNQTGFNIERIVFTYLDYLLYKDNQVTFKDWYFQFRSSIEHFYPQNPDIGEKWDDNNLNGFGNLALITVTGNSQFSNLPPESKKGRTNIINQSLKLIEMVNLIGSDGWTSEISKMHCEDMFKIIENDLKKKSSN